MITKNTTTSNPVISFTPYNAVFSDGAATFDHFKQILKSLSRTDTLFWCARLNLILADPNMDEKTKQEYYLNCFFTAQQIQALNKFVMAHGGSDHVGVVHRGALLELIRWTCLLCSDHSADGETFNKPEVREAFARVLLMASELWGKRVYGDSAFEGTSLDEKRTNALALIRHSMAETRCHPQRVEAIARGAKLFRILLPKFYADFLLEFHNSTGLNLDEYYLCLCTIMVHYTNSGVKTGVGGKEESGIFTLEGIRNSAPHMEALFGKFVELQSTTSEELMSAFWPDMQDEPTEFKCKYSLKPLRERPILKAADGRMIILDPVCFAEKAVVGPLFNVLSQANQNNLFTAFGYAFEDYVGNILQHVYPDPGTHLARRLYPNVREVTHNGIQVADFIIDNVSEIIVIETKAVWIQDDMMSHDDPKVFVEHLRAKYGGEGSKSKKGYKQLARSVSKISTQEWQPAGIDLTRTKRVYPVLIVHDDLLDAPVFGHFLAEEFRNELQPDSLDAGGWMIKGRFHVAPLIVITIDDMECLESSLTTFTLIDLLNAYSKATPDRMVSLNNFLAVNSIQFPLIHNKNLAAGCETILNECMRLVFPTYAKK
ncbi:MAG TPA: hypothetical protein VJZ03_01410, partial [Candidatus Bathyarchaeia archaeon]|nr:hypothetical protein [Candidatus Bathyarchaeia archaeon]